MNVTLKHNILSEDMLAVFRLARVDWIDRLRHPTYMSVSRAEVVQDLLKISEMRYWREFLNFLADGAE